MAGKYFFFRTFFSDIVGLHPSMLSSTRRYLHASALRLHRWTTAEDGLLRSKYTELGPAWTLLSLSLNSRSPVECRRRWLSLSGALEGLSPEARRLVYEEGYEFHQGRLIRIPMEQIVPGPFSKLAASIERVRFRSQRRLLGWGTMERLAVREGYEQYGPNWSFIARRLQFRTGRQCRNMMLRRHVESIRLPRAFRAEVKAARARLPHDETSEQSQ